MEHLRGILLKSGMSRSADAVRDRGEWVEVDDGAVTAAGEYKIVAHRVAHDEQMVCLGYVIEKDGARWGFSGDSARCEGLDKIVESSEVVFIDATRPEGVDANHLSLSGALEYARRYPQKKFYLVHRANYELPELPENVFIPRDGEIVEM